jgi:hypothetical protein
LVQFGSEVERTCDEKGWADISMNFGTMIETMNQQNR